MSDLTPQRMNDIRDGLAARYPARVVTRELVDPNNMNDADLVKGVYTVISRGEGDYTDVSGYEAQDGKQDIVICGDFKKAETATRASIEDDEFTMIQEIKDFCRNLPASLCQLSLLEVRQSGQLAHPYGWIVCRLRYTP